jgi:ribosomal protein L32
MKCKSCGYPKYTPPICTRCKKYDGTNEYLKDEEEEDEKQ